MGPAASKAKSSPTAPAPAAVDGSKPALDQPDTSVMTSAIKFVQREYDRQSTELKKKAPRILLVGDTGAGKSSLVNLVFGFKPKDGATVRAGGRPCTQNFAEWGPFPLAPVRVIDSKGIEKRGDQVEQVSKYIEDSLQKDAMEHVHAVWYFVGDRWQEGDKEHVQKLQEMCGVVVVMNKADMRKPEEVENTRKAIQEDLPSIEIVLCGDPRGTMHWIKQECVAGHPKKEFIVDMERNRWKCNRVIGSRLVAHPQTCGDWGDDRPYGYVELVKSTLNHLPEMCQKSFLCAQRLDLSRKHILAAAATSAASLAAGGAAGITLYLVFAGGLELTNFEAGLYATILAIYNIPTNVGPLSADTVVHNVEAETCFAGIFLNIFFFACSPILTLFSSAISAVVAARRVALFGATMSATCAKMILKLAEVVAQGQGELSEEQVLEIVKAVGGKYEKRTDALEKMTKEENLEDSLTKEIEELCCESEE